MHFEVLTLFPEIFNSFFTTGMMQKAILNKVVSKNLISIREFGLGKHRQVDDSVYGGGPGMLLRYDILSQAMSQVHSSTKILLTPRGDTLDQKMALNISKMSNVCLICGSYEGVDQRFIDEHVNMEVSIGDYVLNRGEVGAMVLMEVIARLKNGYLGDANSIVGESFNDYLLEENQYTKPNVYAGKMVPSILMSGHEKEIKDWRKQNRLINTFSKRADLFKKINLQKNQIKSLIDFLYKTK